VLLIGSTILDGFDPGVGIMLLIALIGMPCVMAYTTVIYWVFRGRVKLERTSC